MNFNTSADNVSHSANGIFRLGTRKNLNRSSRERAAAASSSGSLTSVIEVQGLGMDFIELCRRPWAWSAQSWAWWARPGAMPLAKAGEVEVPSTCQVWVLDLT